MSELAKSKYYQPDIQGLRAIAIALVLFYHSGLPGLPGGYVGVDVFFVISGYLITGLLLRELERDSTISFLRFYARRLRRLLPAASIVLLTTVVVAWTVYSPLALKQFASSAFTTAIYLSNMWFAHLSTDYLAEGTDANPLLHTWSLGVEEQFYLAWPLLMLLVARSGAIKATKGRLGVLFVAIGVVSFGSSLWLTDANQPWAFFSTPARAWEFAAGGLVALWFFPDRRVSPRIAIAASWIGILLTALGALLLDRKTPFPGTAALLPVSGTILLIWAAHGERPAGVNSWLASGHMQWMGDLSYSLYLWHWPIFIFLAIGSEKTGLMERGLGIALVFLASWATLQLIENPIRYQRVLSLSPPRALSLAAAVVTTSAAVTLGTWVLTREALKDPAQMAFQAAQSSTPRIYDDGCHADQFVTTPADCIYGPPDGRKLVVLFGDSHAAHWFPAMEKLAEQRRWRLVSLTKSGCPSIDHVPFNTLFGRAYTECATWREAALERIEALKPALVVLSNWSGYADGSADGIGWWRKRTLTVLQQLAASSEQVVIIREVPHLPNSGPDCLSRAQWLRKDLDALCTFEAPAEESDEQLAASRLAARSFPNVRVVDMNGQICRTSPCSLIEGEIVKYKDSHHLSVSYSAHLAEALGRFLLD